MKSAERALDILELLSRQPASLHAATISRVCGIPRSSTYQLLKALATRGVLAIDDDGRWALSARLAEIAGDPPSLHELMGVLDAFHRGSERVDAGDLARRSGLHVATVNRMLPLLAAEGLVAGHDDGTYSLGMRISIMSARFGAIEQLRTAARPVLFDLRDRTGETANLLVRDGGDALYLDQVESRRALRHAGWIGRRIPLEVSASGKALSSGLRPQTVRDAIEEGVTAIACAVRASSEHPAAVSVTGPTLRLRGPQLKAAKQFVVAASEQISERLEAAR
jgi:DNA-binding IclR family transcriptional regulator